MLQGKISLSSTKGQNAAVLLRVLILTQEKEGKVQSSVFKLCNVMCSNRSNEELEVGHSRVVFYPFLRPFFD